jgi:hypothetical protein
MGRFGLGFGILLQHTRVLQGVLQYRGVCGVSGGAYQSAYQVVKAWVGL